MNRRTIFKSIGLALLGLTITPMVAKSKRVTDLVDDGSNWISGSVIWNPNAHKFEWIDWEGYRHVAGLSEDSIESDYLNEYREVTECVTPPREYLSNEEILGYMDRNMDIREIYSKWMSGDLPMNCERVPWEKLL